MNRSIYITDMNHIIDLCNIVIGALSLDELDDETIGNVMYSKLDKMHHILTDSANRLMDDESDDSDEELENDDDHPLDDDSYAYFRDMLQKIIHGADESSENNDNEDASDKSGGATIDDLIEHIDSMHADIMNALRSK